jgi:hypothetical protein
MLANLCLNSGALSKVDLVSDEIGRVGRNF